MTVKDKAITYTELPTDLWAFHHVCHALRKLFQLEVKEEVHEEAPPAKKRKWMYKMYERNLQEVLRYGRTRGGGATKEVQ